MYKNRKGHASCRFLARGILLLAFLRISVDNRDRRWGAVKCQ